MVSLWDSNPAWASNSRDPIPNWSLMCLNCLITVEAALSGAVVLVGRDGAHRDLASVHGTYRKVLETPAAVRAVGKVLQDAAAASVTWLLDRPVSNSGRLRQLLLDEASQADWSWDVELLAKPDPALVERGDVAASSDSWVLDRCQSWVDLPGEVVKRHVADAWIVDLSS